MFYCPHTLRGFLVRQLGFSPPALCCAFFPTSNGFFSARYGHTYYINYLNPNVLPSGSATHKCNMIMCNEWVIIARWSHADCPLTGPLSARWRCDRHAIIAHWSPIISCLRKFIISPNISPLIKFKISFHNSPPVKCMVKFIVSFQISIWVKLKISLAAKCTLKFKISQPVTPLVKFSISHNVELVMKLIISIYISLHILPTVKLIIARSETAITHTTVIHPSCNPVHILIHMSSTC